MGNDPTYQKVTEKGWLDVADQQVFDAIKDWDVKEFCFQELLERLQQTNNPVLRSQRSKNYVYQAITHMQDAEKIFYIGTKTCRASERRVKHYSKDKPQEERTLL